ncbi:MAG: energy transducer TonB [Thermodesulfobacteriota bacterium]
MTKYPEKFGEKKKKEIFHLWLRNQGVFWLTSFSLHIFIIALLFHLPLYPHQAALPKIIKVSIIEEEKKVTEIPFPNITPPPVTEKAKRVMNPKLKKTKPLEEKIIPGHDPVSPTEKVILDNLSMESAREYGGQALEDESWAKEKIIFPEKQADAQPEDTPQGPNLPHSAMAVNSIPGEGNISEKIDNFPALPNGGTGSGKNSAISAGGVWLAGGGEGQGNMAPPSDGKGGSSHPGDSTPGHGYSKKFSGKGNDTGNLFSFLRMARKKIAEAKRYPWEALRRNWEGKVILSFWVDQKGEVRDIKIIQSSGYKVLDEEAKATLLRASPLPVPPPIEEDGLKIEVPILFRLD